MIKLPPKPIPIEFPPVIVFDPTIIDSGGPKGDYPHSGGGPAKESDRAGASR